MKPEYFPNNHKQLLKTDPHYPYSNAGVDRNDLETEIWFNFAMDIDDDKFFCITVPTEGALVFDKAREIVSRELEKYCFINKLAMNSPARHKRLMELEYAYYKPIREKYARKNEYGKCFHKKSHAKRLTTCCTCLKVRKLQLHQQSTDPVRWVCRGCY